MGLSGLVVAFLIVLTNGSGLLKHGADGKLFKFYLYLWLDCILLFLVAWASSTLILRYRSEVSLSSAVLLGLVPATFAAAIEGILVVIASNYSSTKAPYPTIGPLRWNWIACSFLWGLVVMLVFAFAAGVAVGDSVKGGYSVGNPLVSIKQVRVTRSTTSGPGPAGKPFCSYFLGDSDNQDYFWVNPQSVVVVMPSTDTVIEEQNGTC